MRKNRDASKLKYNILLVLYSEPGLSRYRLRKVLSITSSKHLIPLVQDLVAKELIKEEYIDDNNVFKYFLTGKGIQFVEDTKVLLKEFFDFYSSN